MDTSLFRNIEEQSNKKVIKADYSDVCDSCADCKQVTEVTTKDLLDIANKDARPDSEHPEGFLHRDQHIQGVKSYGGTKYVGMNNYNTLEFNTASETHKGGIWWVERIRMPELQDFIYQYAQQNPQMDGGKIVNDMTRLALAESNVEVGCTCPSNYYHFQWVLTRMDANYEAPESRSPKITNPSAKGTVCKHGQLVLQELYKHIDKIARDAQLKWRGFVLQHNKAKAQPKPIAKAPAKPVSGTAPSAAPKLSPTTSAPEKPSKLAMGFPPESAPSEVTQIAPPLSDKGKELVGTDAIENEKDLAKVAAVPQKPVAPNKKQPVAVKKRKLYYNKPKPEEVPPQEEQVDNTENL